MACSLIQADLVHMGAKYSPCMRKDKLIFENIQAENAMENNTACCIMNDKSSCVQTTKEACSVGLLFFNHFFNYFLSHPCFSLTPFGISGIRRMDRVGESPAQCVVRIQGANVELGDFLF